MTINVNVLGRSYSLEAGLDQFEQRLASFIEKAQAMITAYYQENYKASFAAGNVPKVTFTRGGRYIRVLQVQPGLPGGCAYVFIDTKPEFLGNIYKPAGYKAPAKHARGNLFIDDNGMSAIGVHGATYLR